MFKNATGFRKYRLHNLSICFIHSLVSGGWALGFMLLRPNVMFNDTMHWYRPWARHLPLISMSYFIHDTIDMLRFEISRWTLELLLHHVASLFVFAAAVCPRKFIPYAHWALLMEVNSVFLHLRTMTQLSGKSKRSPGFDKFIRVSNTVTFIVFRFFVQFWQLNWVIRRMDLMHYFFIGIGVIGGTFFLVINTILFVRILASDGYLGEYGRKHAAINRDAAAMNGLTAKGDGRDVIQKRKEQ